MAVAASARDIDAASYGYPLTNPFEATIATTPPEQRPTLPSDDEIDQADYDLKLRPELPPLYSVRGRIDWTSACRRWP